MKVARARVGQAAVVGVVDGDSLRVMADDSPTAVIGLLTERPSTTGADVVPLTETRLLAPVAQPPSLRDFMIFESHVVNARSGTGQPVPEAYYAAPAFYFSNPASICGPDDVVVGPRMTRKLDFELEVAALVGADATDVDPDDPRTVELIAGFALMNDWSARDLQMAESPVGLGPVKGKDFATSLGPWLVTPDELPPSPPGRYHAELAVVVNGRRVGGGDLAEAYFSWGQVLARAAENTRLCAGDVIGSGTIGSGCLLELRAIGDRASNPWLTAGDVVELTGGPLGTLRNRVAIAD